MTIKKFFALSIIAILPLFLLSIYVYAIVISPLPMAIIDRDNSGLISFEEALDANQVGKRPSLTKLDCIEYYWLKNRVTAYELCRK